MACSAHFIFYSVGKDDSIKQSTTPSYLLYNVLCGKICRVGLYSELFCALIPLYLVSLLFAILLSLHLDTFLFFTLLNSTIVSESFVYKNRFEVYSLMLLRSLVNQVISLSLCFVPP